MDIGMKTGGGIPVVVKEIRKFADALEVAGDKLPQCADIIVVVDVKGRLYRPLQKRKNPTADTVKKVAESKEAK